MRSNWHFAALFLLVSLLASCQQNEEIPTIAPQATAPVPPSPTPILPTATPDYFAPRYDDSTTITLTPSIGIVYASEDVASNQNPALIGLEISTLTPISLTLEISRIEDDGRVLLIDRQPIEIQGMTDTLDPLFQPGIQEHLLIWEARGAYLDDGSAGGYVRAEKIGPGQDRVEGLHRPSNTETETEVYLVFDSESGALSEVVDAASGLPLEHQPGDTFQTQITYIEDGDIVSRETGTLLIFDENGELALDARPLPTGRYQLIIRSSALDSMETNMGATFAVDNSNLQEGQYTYIHPIYGYQFRLPEQWPVPAQFEGQVFTDDPNSSLNLSIASQPGMEGMTSSDLRVQVLEVYGDVQILYEEAISSSNFNIIWTAYGYKSEQGQHTGVFIAIVRDEWGHVFDMDGLSSDEELLLSSAGVIVDTLVMRPISPGDNSGKWVDALVDGYVVSSDTSFLYDQSDTDWHRFVAKDGNSFIAIRGTDGIQVNISEMLARSVPAVTSGAPHLAISIPYRLELGDWQWNRIDYSYEDTDGFLRWGFIMMPDDSAAGLVAWAESTPDKLMSLEQETFFLMLADIKPSNQPENLVDDLD